MNRELKPEREWLFQGPRTSLLPGQEQWVSVLLNYTAELSRKHFTHMLKNLNITARHFGALAVLVEKGPLTQIELGRLIAVDRNSMVALTDELEELQLVERCKHPQDRRAYLVTLTRRGREVQEQALALAKRSEEEFYAALSAQEQGQLHDMLIRLINQQTMDEE